MDSLLLEAKEKRLHNHLKLMHSNLDKLHRDTMSEQKHLVRYLFEYKCPTFFCQCVYVLCSVSFQKFSAKCCEFMLVFIFDYKFFNFL